MKVFGDGNVGGYNIKIGTVIWANDICFVFLGFVFPDCFCDDAGINQHNPCTDFIQTKNFREPLFALQQYKIYRVKNNNHQCGMQEKPKSPEESKDDTDVFHTLGENTEGV
jgi:hypothetical protein